MAVPWPNQSANPINGRLIFGINNPLSWYFERQTSVVDNVRRQRTHIVTATIEIARKFTDPDSADNIGRRECECDDQNSHLQGRLELSKGCIQPRQANNCVASMRQRGATLSPREAEIKQEMQRVLYEAGIDPGSNHGSRLNTI
jgi:hypothetical protein